MNTYFKYQRPQVQFIAFMGLAVGFYYISILIFMGFFSDLTAFLTDKNAVINAEMISRLKLVQLITAITSFLLPAFLFGYFSSPKPFEYIGLRKNFSPLLIVLSVALLLIIQPFAAWIGHVNELINFGGLQKSFKDIEAENTRTMKMFLTMNGPRDLAINLFIMALLPAVCEELFFRGSLQKVLLRWTKKPVMAILVSSFVFSLFHLTVFKFLPILTLGIMLGAVYYVTRNIGYCILIHFLNNSLAVLSIYYSEKSETLKKLADDKLSMPFYLGIISIAAAIGIIYYMKRKSDEVLPAIITDDDNDYLAT